MTFREPLPDVFIGGSYIVVPSQGGAYGPFHSPDVALAWGLDALGRGFKIEEIELPWRVPPDERQA